MVHDGAEIKNALNKNHGPLDRLFDMLSARERFGPLLEDSADVKAADVLVREFGVGDHIQRGQGAG